MGNPKRSNAEAFSVNGVDNTRKRRAHILMIPFDEQGHYTVFLQLLYFLSSFDITVTVCTSERRVEELGKLLREGEFKILDLRLVLLSDGTVPGPGLWEVSKMLKRQFNPYRRKLAMEKNLDAKPTCLISDLLLDWSGELAKELQIPRYLMFTTAGWFAHTVLMSKIEASRELKEDEIVEIPGRFNAPWKEVPFVIFPMVDLRNLAGILINTFEELEGENLLEAVRINLQKLPHKPGSKATSFFPVGPMVHIPGYSPSLTQGGQKSKALEWLDEQAPSSVLYVAFGTMADISDSLVYELARGLELSGVPFLWAFRHTGSKVDISTLLPEGFMDRVNSRGFVETGWAPQLRILQHPSTGGFMSHCGWNSSMESISAGVPMLTWHRFGDQPLNARFIVDGLKVGLRALKHDSTDDIVSGEDVAAAVKSLMVDDKGKELRKNSACLKEWALRSMQNGGSSHKNLHQFVHEILVR